MKLYDISVTLPGAPVYPGDPALVFSLAQDLSLGASCNVTAVRMCAHAGTHADAPAHFVPGGKSVCALPPELFVGPARVCTVYKEAGAVTAGDLAALGLRPGVRLLLKTRNSLDGHVGDPEFYRDFCALDAGAAALLAALPATLVGIDYASIGPAADSAAPHRALLGAGVAVLEWLDLRAVPDGDYFLMAAPVKFDADGAPARALLLENAPAGAPAEDADGAGTGVIERRDIEDVKYDFRQQLRRSERH